MSGFFAWGPITVEGRVPRAGEKFINADIRTAAADYFQAMAIPLIRGRLFDEHDTPPPAASPALPSLPSLPSLLAAPRVILIDTLMANELWPGADAIGKRVKFGDASSSSPWETVIGVVGRVKQYGLDADARIAFYRPHTQSPARALFVTIRTSGDMKTLETMVAREIRAFDKDLPLYHVQPMTRRVNESMARQRFAMTLLTGFAVLALALAAVGIYGVMAYQVTQGTREIGIRVALGATPAGILGMVLAHGALVAATGLIAGLVGAYGLAHVMESLLFGVTSHDAATFAMVGAALALVALAAVALPAARAARIDPIKALRAD
jgi:predicted permease